MGNVLMVANGHVDDSESLDQTGDTEIIALKIQQRQNVILCKQKEGLSVFACMNC